jgi:quercetin dioxygenase-like cupin family protein
MAKHVDILAEHALLTITRSRYTPAEPGPDPHVHHEHTDAFYVLDGELRFRLGPGLDAVAAGPGFLVSVPPEIAHTFVAGPDGADFLNFHAPDGGFGAYMRKAAIGFDSEDVDAGAGAPAAGATISAPADGHPVRAGDGELLLKLRAGQGHDHLALLVATLAPGFHGPPPHRHAAMVDCFFVLEGAVTFFLDGDPRPAASGDLVLVEPGTLHTFANESDAPARLLNLFAPAGLDRYLVELGELLVSGTVLTPELMGRLASRYDFERA